MQGKGTVPSPTRLPHETRKFGIGEWYGELFTALTAQRRQELAEVGLRSARALPDVPCPFQRWADPAPRCNKRGGLCSVRLYTSGPATGATGVATAPEDRLRTICPNCLKEDRTIYRWVGEQLLGNPDPVVLGEIGFLSRLAEESIDEQPAPNADPVEAAEDVGRIDNVLATIAGDRLLHWCALEIQVVYMSNSKTSEELRGVLNHTAEALPVPGRLGRPDYRSSGPKRLMPQLQIKVPSLRRWGKKMAVVVDEDFFAKLGRVEPVRHVSNCDIAWFVVSYREEDGRATLVPRRAIFTTLERAVEGLTAGLPVDLPEFERRIHAKWLEVQARERRDRRAQ